MIIILCIILSNDSFFVNKKFNYFLKLIKFGSINKPVEFKNSFAGFKFKITKFKLNICNLKHNQTYYYYIISLLL